MKKKKNWNGIIITEDAIQYFKNIIKKNYHIHGIQISMKKSGCAGYKYQISLMHEEKKINKKDFYLHIQNNIKIYIPIQYMSLIDETKIELKNIDGINMHITFNNPKVKSLCGCGESFQFRKKLPT
ncbi:iron-sulfur cluster assembly accessory protein [Buchnera aphidicola]|uniref:iron-sulfur cluster assembly accessory protein n=1 Tax=Buchnera aphidicola TaxID=9 RepID=UPI0031B84B82